MTILPLQQQARLNLYDTVTLALDCAPHDKALLIHDEQSKLAQLLGDAYQAVLPNATAFNFDQTATEEILHVVDSLAPETLVVLIQSTRFLLNEFRFRLELFQRHLKVIEHPHLARIREEEQEIYIDALAYDPTYYRSIGPALKRRIDQAQRINVICEGSNFVEETELIYASPFEAAKLNIGDYRGMKNIGGQFPIGEVFSEPKQLRCVNGTVQIFAFGDTDFTVHVPERPFLATISQGVLVAAPDAPKEFQTVLDQIRAEDQEVWVRELGFGLNRALTRKRRLSDIGTYERMLGIHLSLGAKHALYTKPGFPKSGKCHVDIFIDVQRVEIDHEKVFEGGQYLIA